MSDNRTHLEEKYTWDLTTIFATDADWETEYESTVQDSQVIQRELMGKNPRWLRRQEEAYLKGMNLLCLSDQDFFPQVRFSVNGQALVK